VPEHLEPDRARRRHRPDAASVAEEDQDRRAHGPDDPAVIAIDEYNRLVRQRKNRIE